jgi:GNAT acetyltransferase-like protein
MSQSNNVMRFPTSDGAVLVVTRAQLAKVDAWVSAFANQRKDRRYYEIVEDTIRQEFEYRYFVFEDALGNVRAVQPFFLLRQDILQGSGDRILNVAGKVRKAFPRFLTMKTLMVGCAAGEGHLDHVSHGQAEWVAARLHEMIMRYARRAKVSMVVLKEFPAAYRKALVPFSSNGFTRVPSLPGVKIHLPYENFEAYMSGALSKATRKDLRRKFRDTEGLGITMEVHNDISHCIDEVYPLYLQVYERSPLQFEKLSKEYLRRLGREMPDKARFFVWRLNGRAVALNICMVNGDEIHDEYLGMDYSVALDLHLYFLTLRDVLTWAMANGYKHWCSSGQGYDPKRRFDARLAPLDLYVSHTWPGMNFIFKRVIPLIEPTRSEKTLPNYPNYADVWGEQ